jgi:hypothetical protein
LSNNEIEGKEVSKLTNEFRFDMDVEIEPGKTLHVEFKATTDGFAEGDTVKYAHAFSTASRQCYLKYAEELNKLSK